MLVSIPVSVGELIDKITILEIKTQNISDVNKLVNVNNELTLLKQVQESLVLPDTVSELAAQLHEINQTLWSIEDFKRQCEAQGKFDSEFIRAARDVYLFNDRRADIKRQINQLSGSTLTEEKSHPGIT